jgi:Hypervirulence associated proteins TUDOR domain
MAATSVDSGYRGKQRQVTVEGEDMAEEYRKGDKVRWKSHGGEAIGEVVKKITEDTRAAGREVRASQNDPQYLVRSGKSGGEAVHKPDALRKDQS